MSKRATREEFICKARESHGDKYDYSKSEYVNARTKVCIICKEHGEFWQTPDNHLRGQGCPRCKARTLSSDKETFVEKAKKIHGENKYDYSKVEYKTSINKVCIICPQHGEFWQTPHSHLNGSGCPKCANKKRLVLGFGIDDVEDIEQNKAAHKHWVGMIRRCYDEDFKQLNPTYIGCSVCEEWRKLSSFKEWFDKHYVEGWELDKDILIKGNKQYSPFACSFVPSEINLLFSKRNRLRGECPIGVYYREDKQKYCAGIGRKKRNIYLGLYSTPEEAFYAYKVAKEAYIKEVADKWKGKLDPRVYKAMYEYQVEITD